MNFRKLGKFGKKDPGNPDIRYKFYSLKTSLNIIQINITIVHGAAERAEMQK